MTQFEQLYEALKDEFPHWQFKFKGDCFENRYICMNEDRHFTKRDEFPHIHWWECWLHPENGDSCEVFSKLPQPQRGRIADLIRPWLVMRRLEGQ